MTSLNSRFFPFCPLETVSGSIPSAPVGWPRSDRDGGQQCHHLLTPNVPFCLLFAAELPSSRRRAHRVLSFEQANARCHTQEGYCKGKQPARRDFLFFLFYFIFTSFICAYGLTRDRPADLRTLVATKNKTDACREFSRGENNPLLLSQDQQLRSGLFVSRPLDFSMTLL